MNKVILCIVMLCLIAGASAAVYITFNPEAILSFTKEKPGPDVTDIVTLLPSSDGSFITPRVDLGVIESDTINYTMYHINKGAEDRIGEVVIDVKCDEGIFIKTDGSIFDFNTFVYTGIDGNDRNLLNVDRYEIVSSEHIRFTPNEVYTFVVNEEHEASIHLELAGMAYGNYTVEIVVN